MLENKEIWKDIKGYEGLYQISNMGRVWSIKSQKILYNIIKKTGYYSVGLYAKNGKMKTESVHRLVALTFIDNPNGYPVVNHINGIKTDNRVENLEWTTVQANTKHAVENNLGNYKKHLEDMTEAARLANMKTYLVYKDDKLIGEFTGKMEAANATGVSEATVRLCAKEHRSTRSGYTFTVKGGDAA